jgi:hypothetical protein
MNRTKLLQECRTMRFNEIYDDWVHKRLNQKEAALILGVSDRTFRRFMQRCLVRSFSRPATSNDNPFSEALFKTVKYCTLYRRKPFENLKHAENWMENFTRWYNKSHLHSGIKFVTPYQRHHGLDKDILARRKHIYESAKLRTPLRWRGLIRC